MNTKFIGFSITVAALLLQIGCSNSTSTSGIASLPKATGAVSSVGAEQILQAAVTGTPVKDFEDITWGGSKSRGMCESGAILKNVLREAAGPDKILCYLGVMESNGAFTASYDGTDKYYEVAGAGEGAALKVKFNITTDTNGNISNFKMWTCDDGSTQSEYISVVNTNGSINMRTIHYHTGSGFTFRNIATATGNYNSSSGWTSKTMTVSLRGTGSSPSFDESGYASITQGASTATLSAFRTGSYSSSNYVQAMYSVMGILNTGSMNTFAVGDGSVKFDGAYNSSTLPGSPATVSWLGDDQSIVSPASNGDHYTAANSGSLPTPSTQTPNFAGDEVWDCSSSSGFTSVSITGNSTIQTGLSACDTQFAADNNRSFIDCHNGG